MAYAKAISVAITIQDERHRDSGKSVSFTIKDQDPEHVTRAINDYARSLWTATSIHDKRHKRR